MSVAGTRGAMAAAEAEDAEWHGEWRAQWRAAMAKVFAVYADVQQGGWQGMSRDGFMAVATLSAATRTRPHGSSSLANALCA